MLVFYLPSHATENDFVEPPYHQPGFWDNTWSNATTGYKWGWPDSGSTEMKSGTKEKDKPQQYWIPDKPKWDDIDLEQWQEYHRHNYTPYAVLRLPFDAQWNQFKLPKGVYQVKLANWNDGSVKTNLRTASVAPPAGYRPTRQELALMPPPSPSKAQASPPPKASATVTPQLAPVQQPPLALPMRHTPALPASSRAATWRSRQIETLSFIQLGKVIAVIPVMAVECVNGCKGRYYEGHAQWGQLTWKENYIARKNEGSATPVASVVDLGTGQFQLYVMQKHARYTALLNKQQQTEGLSPSQ